LNKLNLNKVLGFKDKYSEEISVLNDLNSKFFKFTEKWGYTQISPPIIEKTDLFSNKISSSLTSNIYYFTDPSGQEVSLRPDFTSSIIRMIFENNENLPLNEIRYSYSGEIYRYNNISNKNYISQNGVEFIGNDSLTSDIEITALAILFSKEIVGNELLVSVGHVGIISDVLNYFKLSDRESIFILQNLDLISKDNNLDFIINKAKDFGLYFKNDLINLQNKSFSNNEYSRMLDFAFSNDSNFSQTREKDSIIEGLANKYEKNTTVEIFSDCINLISKLINIDDNLEESVSKANKILSKIPVKNNLSDFYKIVSSLKNYEIDLSKIKINFGLVREWGYYSGFVFNLYNKNLLEKNNFGGGGRYNSLGNSINNNDSFPATGFAIDNEKLTKNIKLKNNNNLFNKIVIFLKNQNDYDLAIKTSIDERKKGSIVTLESKFSSINELEEWSKNNDIFEIIYFEKSELIRRKI
jgi:histidyl-tRNA synthetase|tara:strand:+ start:2300 stop:3703 length:1404 start_codon:yes stop_codon:yes gene_type:complete